MPAGNHGSCIHHPGLVVCFVEYNYHDSLQPQLIEKISALNLTLGYLKKHTAANATFVFFTFQVVLIIPNTYFTQLNVSVMY